MQIARELTSALERLQANTGTSPYVQCSNTLGSVDFVTRDGHEVDITLVHVNRDLSYRLGLWESYIFT